MLISLFALTLLWLRSRWNRDRGRPPADHYILGETLDN
jgi:hypothetical protein